MPRISSYLLLAVRALAVVVIAASLWPVVADAYDGLIVGVAGIFSPEGAAMRAADGRIYLDSLGGADWTGLGIHGFVLHFGLIFAMAVVASTPGLDLVRLAAWLVAAAGLFLVLHVMGISLLAWGLRTALQGEGGMVTVGGTMTAFAIFWALLPALIGGAWCYLYWLPALRGTVRGRPRSLENVLEGRQV